MTLSKSLSDLSRSLVVSLSFFPTMHLPLASAATEKKADAIFDAADFWAAENRHAKAVIAFSRSILRFSDGFARPLNVEFDDGRKQSADVFLRQLVEFWVQQEKDGAF